MKRLTCIIVIFSCCVGLYSQPASYHFNSFDINSGLPGNWINSVIKDSYGYLWIATRYGLARYDGYNFKTYINVKGDSHSIAGNRITKLLEDSKGNLWVGTWQSGISKYDRERNNFINFRNKLDVYNSLNAGYIRDIIEDNAGNLWIVTGNEGIAIFNSVDNKFEYLRSLPGSEGTISSNKLTSLIRDAHNNFWIASRDGTLDIVNPISKVSKSLQLESSVLQQIINTDVVLFFDSDSLLWIGSAGGGLFSYDIRMKKFSSYPQVSNKSILKIIQHGQEILVATDNGGVNIYDKADGSFRYLTSNPFDYMSLNSNGIYDLYFDDQGLFWVSTFDAGLHVSHSKIAHFRHYYNIPNVPGTISHNTISEICETDNGRIFIGTDGGGLNEFFPATGKFSQFKADAKAKALNDPYITCVYYADQKLYVAAYEKGLDLYDLKSGKTISLQNMLYGYSPAKFDFDRLKNIWCVLVDSRNFLWIGTINNGLFCIDRAQKTIKNYTTRSDDAHSISHNSIITLFEDSNHNLWVGTEGGGLNLFDYDKVTLKVLKPLKPMQIL